MTMVHDGYDGGGRCLLQLFFFFPVQRHLPRLLLFGSSPFGLRWGWSCWWLSDGAVEVAGRWNCYGGDGGSSPLCAEAGASVLFSLLIDIPFSVAALWQWWRGRPTVVLLFPSFFLCNFLSPSLCFCRSGLKDLPPSVFSFSLCSLFSFLSFWFYPFCFLLSTVSFPFCLVPPLAFIARGFMCYGRHMVTAGVHYGGEEISRETCP